MYQSNLAEATPRGPHQNGLHDQSRSRDVQPVDPYLEHTLLLTKIATLLLASLTTALVSALGATTELFATAFDFNPKVKHYTAPFVEDAEFGAHPDALSFTLAGQLSLSLRTIRC